MFSYLTPTPSPWGWRIGNMTFCTYMEFHLIHRRNLLLKIYLTRGGARVMGQFPNESFLLWIKWNKMGVRSNTKKKLFPRKLTSEEWVGMGCQFPKEFLLRNKWNVQMYTKSHVSNPALKGVDVTYPEFFS